LMTQLKKTLEFGTWTMKRRSLRTGQIEICANYVLMWLQTRKLEEG
jgi:hypothetical protein